MNIDTLEEVHDRIAKAIKDDPPFTVKEGGLIKDGYSPELDELKNSIKDARKWIACSPAVYRVAGARGQQVRAGASHQGAQ
ncbi:MAG: hypothetical protein EOM68_28680 [Spirochaetia bacterium]|nr:hypothetical protein [Spirochaetia bacterium]